VSDRDGAAGVPSRLWLAVIVWCCRGRCHPPPRKARCARPSSVVRLRLLVGPPVVSDPSEVRPEAESVADVIGKCQGRDGRPGCDALAAAHSGHEAGDPRRAGEAILELVAMPEPPVRLLLGNMAFDNVTAAHRRPLDEWARHETLTRSADG
jgi:hypothetical protein